MDSIWTTGGKEISDHKYAVAETILDLLGRLSTIVCSI